MFFVLFYLLSSVFLPRSIVTAKPGDANSMESVFVQCVQVGGLCFALNSHNHVPDIRDFITVNLPNTSD